MKPSKQRKFQLTIHADESVTASRVLSRSAVILAIGYWLFLVVMTHMPLTISLPNNSDKVVHLGAYFVLAVFVFLAQWLNGQSLQKCVWRTMLLCTIWGALDELTQIPVPGRFGDILDAVADTVGTVFGVVFCRVVVRLLRAARFESSGQN